MAIFVVGLPSHIRARLVAEAARNGVHVGLCLTVKSSRGGYEFHPPNGQAVSDLEAFGDNIEWSSMTIVVLPYVALTAEMEEAVRLYAQDGARVIRPTAGHGDWPTSLRGTDGDDDRLNSVYQEICRELGWTGLASLAQRFESAAKRCSDYVLVGDALERCDEIDPSRHSFVKTSADLLEKFCKKKGRIEMTLEAFFRQKNIELAQSGGINTCIRLMKGAKQIARCDSNLHLKQGDATREAAAARIYFQHLDRSDQFRLFLLYVGPHPSKDIDRMVAWHHN